MANAVENKNMSTIEPTLNTFSHMHGYIADMLPQMKLIKTFQFGSSNTEEYITIFKITAGNTNIENMQLKIKSDVDSQMTSAGSMFAEDSTKIIYRIHANDPSTIAGDLLSYSFR